MTFPSDESIIEIMNVGEPIWEDHHHRSMFLPNTSSGSYDFASLFPTDIVNVPQSPILLQDTYFEGNLCNITQTNPIDISSKPDFIEHVHVGKNCSIDEFEAYKALFKEFRDVFSWSYEDIPGIDPSIVVHEIKNYPTTKPIRKKLRQVHPRKAAAIKAEIEKLLKAGFIYPVPLTEWVSNVVPVNKKQGTIRVCIDFWDLNKACPKDNFSTPYIDEIIDNCVGSVIFSFMDSFSGYNQIEILPPISIRRNSFSHGEPLHIRSYLSS